MNGLSVERTRKLLQQFDFTNLFVEELGWNRYREQMSLEVEGNSFVLDAVAEKRGLVVFLCTTTSDANFPPYALRRKFERQIAKTRHEHLIIYVDQAQTRQVWQWVKREAGRPDACREHEFCKGQSGQALIQKLAKLVVTLDEEESISIVDMAGRTRAAFNVEKITKKFYELFKKEHTAFLKFVEGISDMGARQWYASIMLNRLMFVYFIQKKGFLDNDLDYLRNRLQKMQEEKGEGRFYSFYRQFLLRLFHEGLGKKKEDRDPDLERMLGKVPYLNGGLFDVHELEHDYGDIQISDDAFDCLFTFFEKYHWHLDERPLRQDNEINPDVLGYIFEKYINQKQMGAYYTKEDITEYISKNTIIPYLFDVAGKKCKIAFEGEQSVWSHLQKDPDRYIYEAVKKGCKLPLPPEIEIGLDTTKPNLLERRKEWNRPAPATHALPTEIWREVVARRQRYAEVRAKLAAGAVRSINDCITYNLDICQLAQDVIENCEGPELLRAFWRAIVGRMPKNANEKPESGITILDPTCGSGAFLFAALNILEPLYEACLERMQAFVAELAQSKEKQHPEKFCDFKAELDRVAAHPNQSYFILKSIILNNLYGVDIMAEAVEICKLRLFLKMVAQVERGDQIEPLPDIDFNIRCGNTLVGFATYVEVKEALTTTGGKQRMFGVMYEERMAKIEKKAQDLQQAFDVFRRRQVEGDGSVPCNDKAKVRERLTVLDDELNKALAEKYGVNAEKNKGAYGKWLASHQPFHWFIEYYGIMAQGGFSVIIGNPPYLEKTKLEGRFSIINYETENCRDIYSWVVERTLKIRERDGKLSLIVPVSVVSSGSFDSLRKVLSKSDPHLYFTHFANRPGQLFSGAQNRLTIFILSSKPYTNFPSSTRYYRWDARNGEREALFSLIEYVQLSDLSLKFHGLYPKIGTACALNIIGKILLACPCKKSLVQFSDFPVYWVRVPGYFCQFFLSPPMAVSESDGIRRVRGEVNQIYLGDDWIRRIFFVVLNSSTYFQFFCCYTDGRHINPSDVKDFHFDQSSLPDNLRNQLVELSYKLEYSMKENTKTWRKSGLLIESVDSPQTKSIIDEIDQVLAQHYGFTEEELDYIINYDIKYRVGLGSTSVDDGSLYDY